MSAELFEIEAQYDVSRPHPKIESSPSDHVNVGRSDRTSFPQETAGWGRSNRGAGRSDTQRGGAINDEGVPHDEHASHATFFGCGMTKLFEICVASSIHTMVWVVLLVWIDLFNASHIFSGQSMVDTVFAFAFIWISTFMCYYALVEEDD